MTDDELKRLLAALQEQSAAANAESRRLFDESAERLLIDNRRHVDEVLERQAIENRTHVDDAVQRLATENSRLFAESAERLAAENRRHFDISIDAVKHELRLLSEAVAHVDERTARENSSLIERMDRGFADTQAMIKFSHAELERRVRSLEQAFTELQSRVERLEATTH